MLAIGWLGANSAGIGVGMGAMLLIAIVGMYSLVISPANVPLRLQLGLLARPRLLLAFPAYPDFRARWQNLDSAFTRLLLLLLPDRQRVELEDLRAILKRHEVVFTDEQLRQSLDDLTNQQFLRAEGVAWRKQRLALGTLLYQQFGGRHLLVDLIEKAKREHPLVVQAKRILQDAGLRVAHHGVAGLRCTIEQGKLRDFSPLYAHIALAGDLDRDTIRDLDTVLTAETKDELRLVFVCTSKPPRAGALLQLTELGITHQRPLIPVDLAQLREAHERQSALATLETHVQRYTEENLYDIRTPISDAYGFFGRDDLVRSIERQLAAGQSVLLFGIRKIGKTSVMDRLLSTFAWPIAKVDLQQQSGSGTSRLNLIFAQLCHSWQQTIRVRWPDLALAPAPDLSSLTDQATLRARFSATIETWLSQLAILREQPGLVVALDEVDAVFDEPLYAYLGAALRGIIQSLGQRKRLTLLLIAYDKRVNRAAAIKGAENKLFQFLSEQPVGMLADEHLREMIESIGQQMGVTYDPEALDLLATASGGHAFLARQICCLAFQRRDTPLRIDRQRAQRAIRIYLGDLENYLSELWEGESEEAESQEEETTPQHTSEQALLEQLLSFTSSEDVAKPQRSSFAHTPLQRELLLALAAAPTALRQGDLISHTLPPKERRRRELALAALIDYGLLHSEGEAYSLSIPIYRDWIRAKQLPGSADDETPT